LQILIASAVLPSDRMPRAMASESRDGARFEIHSQLLGAGVLCQPVLIQYTEDASAFQAH